MNNLRIAVGRQGRTILPFLFFFSLFADKVNAQEKDLKPDGTQGEQLEVLTMESSKLKWKDKRWRLFNGRIATFTFGGGFLCDFEAFAPDENSRRQMDSLGRPL